jgi:hypothetical protein
LFAYKVILKGIQLCELVSQKALDIHSSIDNFFHLETVSFVKTLFEVLQNNSYIPAPPKPTITLPAEPRKQISPPKASNPPKQISPPKASNPPKQISPPKASNPPKQISPPKASNPPKQISPPKASNSPAQSSISPKQNNTQKQSNTPPKPSVPPQQPNPPLSPRPLHKRLLSTDESLRPQAAEVKLVYLHFLLRVMQYCIVL